MRAPVTGRSGQQLRDLADMEAACAAEGIWFEVVPSAGRRRIADLVAAGDRAQFADPAWRREIASWMRPRSCADGLPVPRAAGPIIRAAVRTFDLGRSGARRDRRLVSTAPLLAVLGTDGDGPADWFRAGQGLQRVLLVAAGQEVQAGFLNQPCQIPSLRPGVAALLDHPGAPQVNLRLGTTHGPVARRRPAEDVLIEAAAVASKSDRADGGPLPGRHGRQPSGSRPARSRSSTRSTRRQPARLPFAAYR